MHNALNIEAQGNLPVGVSKIEVYDWTRTREPIEILNGEKKLNSYSSVSGFNKGVLEDEVAEIVGLYGEKLDLKDISLVYENIADSSEVIEEGQVINQSIKGGKVLRTVLNPDNNGTYDVFRYNIKELKQYLKSDNPIMWQDGDKITWDLYTSVNENAPSVEWRMFSGKFNLTSEQLNMIKNARSIEAQMVLGISCDNLYGFELMVPFNDIVNIFVNDKITSLNYANRSVVSKYYFNDTLIPYKYPLSSKCPDREYHSSLLNHTGGSHLDTTGLNESNLLDTSIRDNLKIGENTIDILIGNIIDNESLLSTSNGFSKVNLYIIENPKIDIKAMFYTYHDGNIVYYNDDYLPKKDEKVYLRIDIENNSDTIDVENLDLIVNVASTYQIKINQQKVTLDGKTIDVRCYTNGDFSTEGYSISRLKNLKAKEKISIISDDLSYTVTSTNCKTGCVYLVCNIKMNYITDKLTYNISKKLEKKSGVTIDNRMTIPVSKPLGSITISLIVEGVEVSTLNDDGQDPFLLNLVSSKDFVNLSILPGKLYRVEDICLNLDYKINFFLPQDYEIVDTSSYLANTENLIRVKDENISANIEIKIKKKKGSYFYKNDHKDITVNF